MRFLALLSLLALSSAAGATAQISDQITIDGKVHALFSEPFSDYLRKNRDVIPKLKSFSKSGCSASWRGYQAHWDIKDQKLLLAALFANPCDDHPTPIPLATFFSAISGPSHATWFSGRLLVPQGKRIEYVHMGYESKYERYLVITVKDGLVVGTEQTTNPGR